MTKNVTPAASSPAKKPKGFKQILAKLPLGKNKKKRKAPLSAAELRQKLFIDMPVWKSVLVLTWPAILQLFLIGSYTFVDAVFAVQFGSDSYTPVFEPFETPLLPADQVRTYVSAVSPIANFLNAVSILFSVGISTRISASIGAGDIERAKSALKTGNMFSMAVSFLLVPVMIFTASSWVTSQYPGFPPKSIARIQYNSFNYIAIAIGSYPLQAFWQVVSGIFSVDGRNKIVLLITLLPIPINLFFDWLFMGPLGMAIDGGGWATFIANASACFFTVIFLFIYKSDVLNFKNLFSFKIKWLIVFGIVLAGMEPFLRNLAVSLTTTPELETAQLVSTQIYGSATTLRVATPSAFSVFNLVFPLIFAFTQALRPIAAFNYGAKQYGRVKEIFWYTVIYSTVFSVAMYVLTGFAVQDVLMDLLVVEPAYREATIQIIRIILLCMPLYSVAIGAMLIFGSTERLLFSIIGAVSRGFLFLFPFIYIFQTLAVPGADQSSYWIAYPIMTAVSSMVLYFLARINLKTLKNPVVTLDQMLDNFEVWAKNRQSKNPLSKTFWVGFIPAKPAPVVAEGVATTSEKMHKITQAVTDPIVEAAKIVATTAQSIVPNSDNKPRTVNLVNGAPPETVPLKEITEVLEKQNKTTKTKTSNLTTSKPISTANKKSESETTKEPNETTTTKRSKS